MTHPRLRLLRFTALKRQWELNDHGTDDHTGEGESADERRHLKRMAKRARARLTDAESGRFPR